MKRIRASGTDLVKLDIVLSSDGLDFNLNRLQAYWYWLSLVEEENNDNQVIERLKDPDQICRRAPNKY
jgi:hypothetical protein